MKPVVVFDLGTVLSSDTGLYEAVGEILSVSPERAKEGFWGPHRFAYDEGLTDAEYWHAVLLRLELPPVSDDTLAALVAADVDTWRIIRPDAHAMLSRLHDAGTQIAILSNAPHSVAEALPGEAWGKLIDDWFFSAQLGVAKPDPQIYAAVEESLGRSGDQLWFIDDKAPNVDAAVDAGWHAHLWASDADSVAWLRSEGFSA